MFPKTIIQLMFPVSSRTNHNEEDHVCDKRPDINKVVGNQVELLIDDKATIIDVIRKVDEIISRETSVFPVKGCKSLLHLTFHPIAHRFYTHAALTAYSPTERFLMSRQFQTCLLLDGTVVVLALTMQWRMGTNRRHRIALSIR